MRRFSHVNIRKKASLSALAGALHYAQLVEPNWLELTRTIVPLRPERERVKILHLSDFHFLGQRSLDRIEKAIALGLDAAPDIACLTGDYISHVIPSEEAYRRVLRHLSRSVPSFAVMGNHDGGDWAKDHRGYTTHERMRGVLLEAGIELLHNRAAEFERGGRSLTLVGVGDLWAEECKPREAFTKLPHRRHSPVVVLSHNPDSKALLEEYPWQLMLSGHTHGGQIVVPFLTEAFAPIKDKRFLSGLHPWGDRFIYVTRGVGNGIRFRFNCRPEISIVEV